MIPSKLPKSKRFSTLTSSPSPSSFSRHSHQSSVSLTTLFKSGFNPTLKHYNKFLANLFKTKKFRFITHFISQLNANQIELDHIAHSIFTRALLKQHNYEKAVGFINTHIGKTPTILQNRILDSIIQGFCVNAKDPERGFSILQEYLKIDGILPSSFTFYALISSFRRQGKMDRAIEVLETMTDEKFNYPFDNFVFGSVISGFVNIGKFELAVGFYENAAKSVAVQMNIVTYTSLLSAYCRLERFEQVSDLVSRIKKDGLAFDVVFYSNLVHEYFRAGIVDEALRKHKEMVEKKIESDTISYTILIDGFSKEGLVEKALGFLYIMEKNGIKPNIVTYTAIIFGYCKKGKLNEALVVLKIADDLGIKMDEFAYATLIDGFCKKRDFDCVFRFLDEMNEKGVNPSVVTYNTIINGLCKSGKTNEAYEVSKSVIGDVFTYSTMLHGYIEEKDSVGMLMMKKRLEESGVCMDVVMCNVLIKALFTVGSFEDVFVIFKGMPDMGLTANDVTYCTLIDGFCKFGRIDEALEVFDEFQRSSMASVACYYCIINGLCKNNMLEMAIRVFIELNERDLPLNPGIIQILLKSILRLNGPDGIFDFILKIKTFRREVFEIICDDAFCLLCNGGFFEFANDLYAFMRQNGYVLSKKSYDSFLELLNKDQKTDIDKIYLSDFVKKFGIFEPRVLKIILHHLCTKNIALAIKFLKTENAKTQNITFPVYILEKLAKNGRANHAFNLLIGLKERLPIMDIIDYTIVIDGLCKDWCIKKALDVCILATKNRVNLSIVTYNSIINGLCQQGCFIEAFRLFDSLEKINISPSDVTYATLIDALCKEGRLYDAKNLFDKMVLNGLEPNIRVYNSLINGYSKLGKLTELLKFVVKLDEKGVKPDGFSVSVVINCFCRNGDMEGALEYYFESKTKGFLPDLLGFFYLIRGLCSKGRMEESRSVLRDMLENENIIEVLKKVDMGFERESLDQFLGFLCDRGNIKEAIMILDDIVGMFFPVGKRNIVSEPLILGGEDEGGRYDDFDAYYGMIAALCSRGEMKKANKVAKLITSFHGG